MDRSSFLACSTLVIGFLGVVLFQLYKFIQILLIPGTIEVIADDLKAIGICTGIILLGGALFLRYLLNPPGINHLEPLKPISRDYPVRGVLDVIDAKTNTQDSATAPGRLEEVPVYLLFSLTNYGISLRPISTQYNWKRISAENESRFRALSGDRPGQIILPRYDLNLHYHNPGEVKLEVSPDGDGYGRGPLPEDLLNKHIEIVITYRVILDEGDLNHMVGWEQPLRLRLVALDQNGDDDWETTCKLYPDVYEFIYPHLPDDYVDPAYEGYNDPHPPWHY